MGGGRGINFSLGGGGANVSSSHISPLPHLRAPPTAIPSAISSAAGKKSRPKGGSNHVPEIRCRSSVEKLFDVDQTAKESERVVAQQQQRVSSILDFVSIFISIVISVVVSIVMVFHCCICHPCIGQAWIAKPLFSVRHKLLLYFRQLIISQYFRIIQ